MKNGDHRYYFHNFEHKDYNKFIGGEEQDFLNKNINLKKKKIIINIY